MLAMARAGGAMAPLRAIEAIRRRSAERLPSGLLSAPGRHVRPAIYRSMMRSAFDVMEATDNTTAAPERIRLPNRRPLITETLVVGGQAIGASVGFDPATGRPRELFLTGAKDGTDLAAILDDASVVLSVALQHGVLPAELVRSVARLPTASLAPPYLDQLSDGARKSPASVIGAALDLVASFEGGVGP